MADKPITFSAPMVRALLAGTKTQTRRLVSNPEYYGCPTGDCPHNTQAECNTEMAGLVDEIARFKVGDRVYVREHWKTTPAYDDLAPSEMGGEEPLRYLADDATFNWAEADGVAVGRHRQAMHMPRWASRMWLEITDVRVQRLQDISNVDARMEGVDRWKSHCATKWYRDYSDFEDAFEEDYSNAARLSFQTLWNSLHSEPGTTWADNPWIVAYTFKVHHGNIDGVEHNGFPGQVEGEGRK